MQTRWKVHPILVRMQTELEDLRNQQQFRQLSTVEGVNLCSNDYLGLSDDPRLKAAVVGALEQDNRYCSGGSRLLSGNSALWEELESELAAFVGTESALYFSSGYMANIGLLTAIVGSGSTVFSDSANHASLIDGIRLTRARKVIFSHGDLNRLEQVLRSAVEPGERFIVVESIFSMDGDRARLQELYTLADRYGAGIIVDEAHATGVAGPSGRGLVAESGRPDCVIATMHTCGKALASMGAFVACSDQMREYLINKSRSFIFSTALPPYMAAQTREAIRIVQAADGRRHHLRVLSEFLRSELARHGFGTDVSGTHIVPVILGSNEAALETAERLCRAGFGIKAIRPPTVPPDTARLRVSLTSRLSLEQLTSFMLSLNDGR